MAPEPIADTQTEPNSETARIQLPQINSPLGHDATPDSSPNQENNEEPAPVSEPETPETPPSPENSEAAEKARLYDYMMSDPRLTNMINQYYGEKSGRVTTPDLPKPEAGKPEDRFSKLEKQLEVLSQQNELLMREQAQTAIRAFKAANPDFDQYAKNVGGLLNRFNGMTLDEAYQIAKATSNGNGSPAKRPSLATTETKGGGLRSDSDPLEEARRQIDELSAKPRARTEDAIKIAYSAAMKAHRK